MNHRRLARYAEEQPPEQRAVFIRLTTPGVSLVLLQLVLHPLPQVLLDDSLVLAGIEHTFVVDLPGVKCARKNPVERVLVHRCAAASDALCRRPPFRGQSLFPRRFDSRHKRASVDIEPE